MPAKIRYVIWGVLFVAAGAGAVWSFTRNKAEEQSPDTPDSITHWACEKCGTQIELTARKFDEWVKDPNRIPPPGKSALAKVAVFKCDKCGTFTVGRATYCRVHDLWFLLTSPTTGKQTNCPKCPPE